MATFTVTTIDQQPAAVVRAEVPMDELRTVFDRGFGEVMRVTAAQGVAITGPPFGFYPRMPTDTVEVLVGFPVAEPVAADGDVRGFELPGGRVVTGMHVGPYERLETSYRELTEWAASHGHALAGPHVGVLSHRPAHQPGPGHLADQDHRAACLSWLARQKRFQVITASPRAQRQML
jgi:effector-binding domain-containing protein